MGLLANENAISSGGYTISKSLRFRASASAYLNRTPASAGNRQKWTYSTWVKRGQLNIANGLLAANDAAVGGGSFGFNTSTGGGVADAFYLTLAGVGTQNTTALFRDPSAWYHIVVALDTTQATQADRFKLYINGTQYTFSSNIVGLNASYDFNNAIQQRIGTSGVTGSTTYADDYLSELNFIDGQALTPSSFGQTDVLTGVWTAKKYTGTYGTNGFYLPFTDTSSTTNLVKDSSGNGNNWTPNNISLTAGVTYDSMIDSPTITASGTQPVGNYAVLNPLDLSATCSLSNGNIRALVGAGTASLTRGTFSVTTGKWYWEVTVTTDASALAMIGIAKSDVAVTNANFNTANGWYYYATNGNFYTN